MPLSRLLGRVARQLLAGIVLLLLCLGVESLSRAVDTGPIGFIDSAVNQADGSTTLPQGGTLVVKGWAADPTTGAPVVRVSVRIDGNIVGLATLNQERPDIRNAFGRNDFLSSGWSLTVNIGSLPVGTHQVTAVAVNSAGTQSVLSSTRIITVGTLVTNPGPLGVIESAVNQADGTTTLPQNGTLVVKGWAADRSTGAPVTTVTVSIDGVSVGNATLNTARPDVAAAFGRSDFASSGWSLTVNITSLSLPVGTHTVTAVAFKNSTQANLNSPRTITVGTLETNPGPLGLVESAVNQTDGSTTVAQGGTLLVKGWAADRTTGAPVTTVTVSIDHVSVGNATLNAARPDVAAAFGRTDFTNSGWSLSVNIGNVTPGPHTVTAVAFKNSAQANLSTPRTVNVVAPNPIATLTSLSPTSATAGAAGFVLTVTGSNFVAGSVVRWNGSNRTTFLLSGTQITAWIPTTDIAASGTAQVTVFNPAPGGGLSNALNFPINNPVPTITSLSPSSYPAGAAGFTLTVNGLNFVSGSVVRWNGSGRTTTFVSRTQVTAAILASDIAGTGQVPVTVFNPTPGGGLSGALTFFVQSSATPEVDLNLFPVDGGSQVSDAQKVTTGTNISINDDDDGARGQPDNSDTVINGAEDRRDMARLQLNVQPSGTVSGTIQLSADNPSFIRIFNNLDQPVTLPETIAASRFNSGAISYYVEGLAAGTVTFTLTLTGTPAMSVSAKIVVGQQTGIKMTFDDGPHAEPDLLLNLTQIVLNTLAQNSVHNNIKAAFFIQTHVPFRGGNSVGQAMMTAESNAGHHVEVHTGSTEDHVDHKIRAADAPYDANGDGIPDGQNGLESDMIRAKARITLQTGRTPIRVRPPFGDTNQTVLDTYARQSLTEQLWDVVGGDDTSLCQQSVNCMQTQLTTGSQNQIDLGLQTLVVLMHDIQPVTANNLDTFLKTIAKAVRRRGRNERFDLL